MSLKQEAVTGVVWSAAQKWGVRIISFFVIVILARLVLPESFGLVAYAIVFTSFAQIIIDQGFSDAIVQFTTIEREHLDTAFWISVFTGTTLTLASIAASGLIANIFNEPQLREIIIWLSPIFILGALSSVQQSILRRKLDFKKLTLRSLISTSTSGVIAIAMALKGFGVWSLVAKLLVDSAVGVIALWKISDWRPSLNFSWKHFRELFSFGINIVGGDLVDFLSVHSDDFLIGYYLGTEALGYYTMAYNLLNVLTDLLVTVPNKVAFPIFSRIQNDPIRLKSAFYEVTQLQSIVAFPLFLGLFVVAPEVVHVLYSDKWVVSIPVIQILMFMGMARSASYFYSSIFRAAGKPSWRFGIYSLTATLNVVGFLIVVRMGINAVAASYVTVSYLLMPIYFLMIRNLTNVTIQSHLKQYAPAFLSSLIMIVFVFFIKNILGDIFSMPIRLVILIAAGGGSYILGLRLIHPTMLTKLLEIIRLALPKFLIRQN